MKKRGLSLVLISVMAGTLTSCAGSVNLTDAQSDLVAEYVSSVMLKYDKNENGNKLVKLEEEEVQATPQVTEQPMQTPLATTTPEQTSEPNKGTDDNKSDASEDAQDKTIAEMKNVTFESLYGLKDVSITYNNVKEYKTYPKDEPGQVTATDHHKFVVVSFKLTNQSKDEVSVDLLKGKVSFALKANDGEWISGAHTLLGNDMTYYQGKLKGNKSQELVVLFEVKDSFKLSNGTFYALSEQGKACEVTIK